MNADGAFPLRAINLHPAFCSQSPEVTAGLVMLSIVLGDDGSSMLYKPFVLSSHSAHQKQKDPRAAMPFKSCGASMGFVETLRLQQRLFC